MHFEYNASDKFAYYINYHVSLEISNYKHAYLGINDRYCFDNGYIVR